MYRFALSPTRDMHIKELRTALFNYICAKQANKKFIIRIQDMDREKNIDANERETLEILHLLGIEYDQVLYQSENLKFHRQLGSKLLMDGHAFSCFCTKDITSNPYDGTCKKLTDEEVMANEAPFVVRIKEPSTSITFTDTIKGDITVEAKDIDDFVILKVDKTPTYDFATALDDMLSAITVIIQEDEHIENIAKQELIRKYLGYTDEIKYAHLPSILDEDNLTVASLLEEGYLPQAIINYLILLENRTPTEIFTLEESIKWFDLKNISKSPVKFEIEKLKELNRKHINMLEPLELSKFIGYSSKDIGELAKVYLKDASTINQIKDKIDTIFSTKVCEEFTKEFESLKEVSNDMPYFKEFDEFKTFLEDKSGLKGEKFLKPLNVLLTGATSGPSLSEIYPHIKNYLGEIIK